MGKTKSPKTLGKNSECFTSNGHQPFSSFRNFQKIFAPSKGYFTEKRRWVRLFNKCFTHKEHNFTQDKHILSKCISISRNKQRMPDFNFRGSIKYIAYIPPSQHCLVQPNFMITIIYIFLSLRAGGILQILQSDWFRERAVFYRADKGWAVKRALRSSFTV